MKDLEKPDQEPEIVETAVKDTKPNKPFSKVRREVIEEELVNNPAAIRLLLGQLDKAEYDIGELSEFQKNFYETDKTVAILKERLKTSKSVEVMFAFCLTIGALLIGLTPSQSNGAGIYFLWIGAVLIIVGTIIVILRVIMR